MVKRKGSIISKDEEQVSKRRLRSGRVIETLTSPLRLTKEVVTTSAPSNPRVKPFTSTKSAMGTARVIDNEDGRDEKYDELCSTSSHDSQAIVVHKKVLPNETNMNGISADMGSVEKKGFQGHVLHGKTSISKAKSTRKTAKGDELCLESGSSPQLLRLPEESPVKTVMEVTIYTPRKKSRRLSTAPSEDPDISPPPSRVHNPEFSLHGTGTVGSSKTTMTTLQQSGSQKSNLLPSHLHSCLNAQKRAILRTLQHPTGRTDDNDNLFAVNESASRQLGDLIEGTTIRAEGNSCILLGPRGSGKSRLVEDCIDNLKTKPIVLRLSGWLQSTDRHALREIGFQLLQQTGLSMLEDSEKIPSNARDEGASEDDDNPFLDSSNVQIGPQGSSISLPPSSHLHTLIPILSTLDRPVIVVLDAFDLFALHPRQSLLYCLLDTVQNCRANSSNRGIAVIGITNRVDTIQLLEKRVKSRFSGRTIRTAPPNSLASWTQLARGILHTPALACSDDFEEDWKERWTTSVDKLFADKAFSTVLNETFSITRDVRTLVRILTTAVLQLNPNAPYLSPRAILASVESQRARPRYPYLMSISYSSMCLLIASVHADTAGHSTFTFEMLFNNFQDQARASTSAPVQVNGGSIGMVRCTRQIFMSAFEELVATSIFIAVAASSLSVAKEFVKYRCAVEREFIKGAVEKSGQVILKKWLNKAQ